ncbi:MAG: glutamate-cysteine ligase family protein [Pirellulaceae bacterium]
MSQSHELFEVFGVELEYMIVDRSSLDVSPVADRVLQAAAGEIVGDVELGEISWSNELALHVIELKTSQPARSLAPLADAFSESIAHMQPFLRDLQTRLLPTAMHPWMDPDRELKLWPHDYNPIYEAYNRIFDCRGQGWANLQSVHLNLPFAGDDQFGRLHAAIRILLPLLPALAASSPVVAGALTGYADNRMRFYRHNSQRVPSLTGQVVPEPVFSRTDYERHIFQVMYRDIAPFDTDKILCHEWLNSRSHRPLRSQCHRNPRTGCARDTRSGHSHLRSYCGCLEIVG